MIKKLLGLLLFSLAILYYVPFVVANQGCCSHHGGQSYCDYSTNRWVCMDGTYSPSCTCGYISPPVIYQPRAPLAPDLKASFTYTPNPDGQTFNVLMRWNDVPNTGFSIALHRYAGGDPGPLIDTAVNYWTFQNVLPGKYYADMKVGVNHVWSNVVYWEVIVPQWYSPTPPPLPITTTNTSPPSANSDWAFIGILILIFIGGLAVLTIYKVAVWFIAYAKAHDWVYSALLWGAIIVGIIIYNLLSNKPRVSNPPPSKYTCNCAKTCPNMTCAEAYYQLQECGCSARDGDGDGIPCEAQCK